VTATMFAGIDGGGTKTAIVLVNADGTEIARHVTSTSNAAVVGHEAAGAVLRDGLSVAIAAVPGGGTLAGAWFGLSGSDRPEDHRRLRPWIEHLAPGIRMTNDAELILAALPDETGVAIVSGTGSIAFGRNADGTRARAGGWGHVFGDEGSGYDLARRMFDAYAREIDGRGPATTLTKRLMEHLALAEPFQLIAYVYASTTEKADLAALSTIVIEEAAAGDQVAGEILAESAAELATTTAAVARRLGFRDRLPLALTGGLLTHVSPFREAVLAPMAIEWPELDWRIVDDPALSAAKSLARSHITQGALT